MNLAIRATNGCAANESSVVLRTHTPKTKGDIIDAKFLGGWFRGVSDATLLTFRERTIRGPNGGSRGRGPRDLG